MVVVRHGMYYGKKKPVSLEPGDDDDDDGILKNVRCVPCGFSRVVKRLETTTGRRTRRENAVANAGARSRTLTLKVSVANDCQRLRHVAKILFIFWGGGRVEFKLLLFLI